MAEDEELQVLGRIAAGDQHEQLDGATQRDVGEFRQDQGDLWGRWQERYLPSHDRHELAAHSRVRVYVPHNRNLVPQHQQLHVVGRRAPCQEHQPSKQLAEHQIEQS